MNLLSCIMGKPVIFVFLGDVSDSRQLCEDLNFKFQEALTKKYELISKWSELDKREEHLQKETKDILKDTGTTEVQIEWGINLPKLSWKNEKRMRKLETEYKDVIIEMTAIKGVEEALKNWKAIDWLSACIANDLQTENFIR